MKKADDKQQQLDDLSMVFQQMGFNVTFVESGKVIKPKKVKAKKK